MARSLSVLFLCLLCFSITVNCQTLSFTQSAAARGIALDANAKDGGVVFADINRDGHLDLVVNTQNNNATNGRTRIFVNDGTGNFTDVTSVRAPAMLIRFRERQIIVADLNNDGYVDIVRTTGASVDGGGPQGEIYMQHPASGVFGNGTGGSTPIGFGNAGITYSGTVNIEGVSFFDYDGDGDLDLFVENHSAGVKILRNNIINHVTGLKASPAPTGTALFTNITTATTGTQFGLQMVTGSDGDYMASGDFNNDGWIDLLVRKNGAGIFDLYRNLGDGNFTGTFIANTNNSDKGGVAFYDLDNDGDLDIVWTSAGGNLMGRNNGDNTFTWLTGGASPFNTAVAGFNSITNVDGVAGGDFDNDGDIDLILSSNSKSYIFINNLNAPGFPNSGTPLTFTLLSSFDTDGQNSGNGEGITVGDIDGDGDLEIYENKNGSANRLWINNLYSGSTPLADKNYLSLYVFEDRLSRMATGEERYSLNATILMKDTDGNIIGPALNVNQTRGHGCQDGGPAHIGLPFGRDYDYVFEAYYPNDAVNFVVSGRPVITKTVNPHREGITTLAFRPGTSPIAISDFGTTFINQTLTGNVLWNDRSNYQNVEVNTTPVVSPSNGVLTLLADGSYTYIPNAGFTGSDQFSYQMCYDASTTPQLCDNATVNITVSSIPSLTDNNPPIASADHFTTPVNTARGGSLMANDVDPDGDNLVATTTPVVAPSNGIITINADGSFTYTPNASFVGKDSLRYRICDDGTPSICDTAWAFFSVIPLAKFPDSNLPPSAVDDFFTILEDDTVSGSLIINDQDDSHTITINTTPLNNPDFGSVTINSDGTFEYIPNRNFWGTDQFSYRVCDSGTPSLCDSARVVILVRPVNDAPNILPSMYYTYEDMLVQGNVMVNVIDVENDTLDLITTPIIAPTNGVITFNPDGTFLYEPNTGFTGTEIITFEVCDRGTPVMCEQSTLTIEVLPLPDASINNPPKPLHDDFFSYINQVLAGSVMLNDRDPDGDNLTATTTLVTGPANGAALLNPDGTFTYTPTANFTGSDSFEYEVCDDGTPSLCATAIVNISVLPNPPIPNTNRPPLLTNDFYVTTEEVNVGGDVSLNDLEPDGHPLTFSLISSPALGDITFNPDGTFSYSPAPNENGPDYFVYEACDDQTPALCREATAHILIRPVNDSPIAIPDYNVTYIETQVTGNVRINDKHPDNLPLSVNATLISAPSNGTLILLASGDYSYTPAIGFTGTDVAVYEVCDNRSPALCSTAEIHFTVMPLYDQSAANNPPIAATDVRFTQINQPLSATVIENDFDMDGDLLTVNTTPTTDVTNGILSLSADGSFTYTPNPSFSGTDFFEYEVCDDGTPSLCSQARTLIVVGSDSIGTSNNKAPYAADLFFLVFESTALSANVSINDVEPDGQTLNYTTTAIRNPTNGQVIINSDGTFTYTPDQFYVGPDNFSYVVCDGQTPAKCDSATAYFLIRKDNNPPVTMPDINQTYEDEAVDGNVLVNDRDPDGGNLTVNTTLVSPPADGIVSMSTNGDYTYTPNPGFTGRDMFIYEVCNDGNPVKCSEERAIIIVYDVALPGDNNPPLANSDIFTTFINQAVPGTVASNDFDPDLGDTITISLISPPTNHSGVFTIDDEGNFTYTPNPGFWGLDSFEYRVCDNQTPSLCDSAIAYIRVIGSSSAVPLNVLARDNFFFGATDSPKNGNVLGDDSDLGGRPLAVNTVLVSPPANGNVTLSGDGSFSFEPDPSFSGPDFFTYQVCNDDSPQECANASAFFLFGGFSGPLPVTLVSFIAIPRFPEVDLKWKTLSEVNNRAFLLYKSSDHLNWTLINEIAGAGTVNTPQNYFYTDTRVAYGTTYYKLVQEDNDGTQSIEGIVAVHYGHETGTFIAYPNPVAANSGLTLSGLNPGSDVIFTDLSGREVFRTTAEYSVLNINTEILKTGIYIVQSDGSIMRLIIY